MFIPFDLEEAPNGQRQPLAEAKPKASRLHAVLGGDLATRYFFFPKIPFIFVFKSVLL
jgi:hypothetical protein